MAKLLHFTIWEGSAASLMFECLGTDGTDIQQADISAISWKIWDDTQTLDSSGVLVVADSVFDTLQTDARWTVNSTGYNFRHDMAAADVPAGGQTYRIEWKFTEAGGGVFVVSAMLNVLDTLTT